MTEQLRVLEEERQLRNQVVEKLTVLKVYTHMYNKRVNTVYQHLE